MCFGEDQEGEEDEELWAAAAAAVSQTF